MITAFGCVSAVVDAKDIFNAIGVLSMVQCIGITFFPALGGGIFQNLGAELIASYLPSEFSNDPRVILAGVHSPEFRALSEVTQAQVSGVIVDAMSNLYIMVVVACGITVLISPFLGVSRCASFIL